MSHDKTTRMLRLFLLPTLFLLFFAANSSAQISNCIKGDFIKEMGVSQNLTETEDKLCAEMNEDSDLQGIYGFVIAPEFGQVVRVYKNRVVFTYYEDYVRYRERDLTGKEAEALRKLLNEIKLDAQPPLRDVCIDMCLQYEFLSIERNGARRVAIFAHRYAPPKPLDKLANYYNELSESGNFTNHYYIQGKAGNFEVLLADNVWSARAVWKQGNDFRVLVEDASKRQGNYDAALKYFENSMPASGAEDYGQRLRRLKRRAEIEHAHYSWRKFENGRLGENVPAPVEIPYFDTDWRFTVNGYKYLNPCVSITDCALLKVNDSIKPILIRKGNYDTSDITVSSDGRWLVTAKEDRETGWEKLVRINLQTNEEFLVDVELSYEFAVIAFIEEHDKFLIRQRKWMGHQKEMSLMTFLLNADTGKLDRVSGNFDPLLYQSQDRKPLQPTGKPHLFWVASHDFRGHTQFGLYDTKSFTFKALARWPHMEFESNGMWVDEKEKKIYFVYGGHLLALPLPKTVL
ncbi:MAG TPA: hypothetical protein VEY11_13490 [Pyrinomonadaceae bacterium]|nr:hypothetical protein [Pyrinomonadaceae bacterium]